MLVTDFTYTYSNFKCSFEQEKCLSVLFLLCEKRSAFCKSYPLLLLSQLLQIALHISKCVPLLFTVTDVIAF